MLVPTQRRQDDEEEVVEEEEAFSKEDTCGRTNRMMMSPKAIERYMT